MGVGIRLRALKRCVFESLIISGQILWNLKQMHRGSLLWESVIGDVITVYFRPPIVVVVVIVVVVIGVVIVIVVVVIVVVVMNHNVG